MRAREATGDCSGNFNEDVTPDDATDAEVFATGLDSDVNPCEPKETLEDQHNNS